MNRTKGTLKRLAGPMFVPLFNADRNIYTPPANTIYAVIRHIHVSNVSAGAVTFWLYVGGNAGTVAGTEIVGERVIDTRDEFDYDCITKLVGNDSGSAGYLTGWTDTALSLVITVEGEQFRS